MRNFVEKHGHGGDDSHLVVGNISYTDGKAICEVVNEIANHANDGVGFETEFFFFVFFGFFWAIFLMVVTVVVGVRVASS